MFPKALIQALTVFLILTTSSKAAPPSPTTLSRPQPSLPEETPAASPAAPAQARIPHPADHSGGFSATAPTTVRLASIPVTARHSASSSPKEPDPEEPNPEEPNQVTGDFVDGSFKALSDSGWIPPDPTLTVGPDHIVEAVNAGFAVYSKLGREMAGYRALSDFFASVLPTPWAGEVLDPKLVYSVDHQRYLLLALGRDTVHQTSYFFLAISQTDDPTGDWWQWQFEARIGHPPDADSWLDDVSLAVDTWGVYVTGNLFRWTGGTFKYNRLYALNPAILSGGANNGWTFWRMTWPNGPGVFSLQAAQAHSIAGGGETFFINSMPDAGDQLCLWTLTGDRTDDPSLARAVVDITPYQAIGHQVGQPGTSVPLDGGDARVASAVYSQRRLYANLTTDPDGDGSSAGVITAKVHVDSATSEWLNLLSDPGYYYVYPALTIAGGTSIGPEIATYLTWTHPASGQFASSAVKFFVNHPADDSGPFWNMADGLDAYVALDGEGSNRWGESSAAVYDWTCANTWGAVEYAGPADTWRTRIAGNAIGGAPPCGLIDLTFPNGGEVLAVGTSHTVTWNRANLDPTAEIYVFFDDGSGPVEIAGPLPTVTTSFLWHVPNTPTTSGRITVGAWDGFEYQAFDGSDDDFTITSSPICSPNQVLSCPSGTDSRSNGGPGSTDNINTYGSCDGFGYTGPEVAYRFQAETSTAVEVTLRGLTADLDLLLLEDADNTCEAESCVHASMERGLDDEVLAFQAEAGTVYYLVVEGFDNAVGSYDLELTCALLTDGFESGDTTAWSELEP